MHRVVKRAGLALVGIVGFIHRKGAHMYIVRLFAWSLAYEYRSFLDASYHIEFRQIKTQIFLLRGMPVSG